MKIQQVIDRILAYHPALPAGQPTCDGFKSGDPNAGLVMYGCFTAVSWPGSDAFMKMREDREDFVMPRGGLVSVYMDEQRPDKYWFSPSRNFASRCMICLEVI